MNNGSQRSDQREPYNFGRPFDNRRPARLSVLQHMCIEGHRSFDDVVADFKASLVAWALAKFSGNQTKAARYLCIKRSTLVEILARMDGRR